MTGQNVFLAGIAVLLLTRATWLSIRRHRHLAWISALSGPVALAGALVDQGWLFVTGLGLLAIGEFLYQMSDEASPRDLSDLRQDDSATSRPPSRRRITRPR